MSPDQLKLVIDSIVWAFRHTERNIAETGNVHAQHFQCKRQTNWNEKH